MRPRLWHIHCCEKGTAMNRKLWLLALLLFTSFNLAEAQQPKKVPRIGILAAQSPSSSSYRVEAFRKGLIELGYTEGKNIAIEYRYADGRLERLPDLAACRFSAVSCPSHNFFLVENHPVSECHLSGQFRDCLHY